MDLVSALLEETNGPAEEIAKNALEGLGLIGTMADAIEKLDQVIPD